MDRSAEIVAKTDRVIRMLAAESLGGALIKTQHNFSWLTAGGSHGIDMSSEAGAAGLLVRADGKRFVLANRIEMPRLLAEELSANDFEPIEFAWEDERSSPTFVADLARDLLENPKALGSDLPMGSTRHVEGAIARCRRQLTASEIERYRALGRDAGTVVGELARTLKPGETEEEIARRVSNALAERDMRGVVTLIAADERLQAFRHPLPTEKRWRQMLMIVVCARRAGLIASLTRIICAGPIPDELKRRTMAAAEVDAQLLAATRPGTSGADLYHVAARAYATQGFPGEEHLHHQGGATGYRTRDWVAHPHSEETVSVSQAFAWNPSVTGTKVEETCICFEDHVEIITGSPGWPAIVVEVTERPYELPAVLSL